MEEVADRDSHTVGIGTVEDSWEELVGVRVDHVGVAEEDSPGKDSPGEDSPVVEGSFGDSLGAAVGVGNGQA